MAYWRSKRELTMVKQFKSSVIVFVNTEREIADFKKLERYSYIDYSGTPTPQYYERLGPMNKALHTSREYIARHLQEMKELAVKHDISYMVSIQAPPGLAHLERRMSVFETILDPEPIPSQRFEARRVVDIIDGIVNACENQVRKDFWRLFNPFYWLVRLLVLLLRLPFMLLEIAGFHIEKFEEQLWARLFKILEFVVIAYFLHTWGFKPELWLKDLLGMLK